MTISKSTVRSVLEDLGYHPVSSYLNAIVEEANNFDDKNEAVMFLAQTAHETLGYQFLEEVKYVGKIATVYGTGARGKSYHGRGFIQLTGPRNYKDASEALRLGNELYIRPELVVDDISIAVDVSTWYWRNRVRPVAGDMSKFGLTTKAINGAEECNGKNVNESKNRYRIYKALARELGIRNMSSECGCYN